MKKEKEFIFGENENFLSILKIIHPFLFKDVELLEFHLRGESGGNPSLELSFPNEEIYLEFWENYYPDFQNLLEDEIWEY